MQIISAKRQPIGLMLHFITLSVLASTYALVPCLKGTFFKKLLNIFPLLSFLILTVPIICSVKILPRTSLILTGRFRQSNIWYAIVQTRVSVLPSIFKYRQACSNYEAQPCFLNHIVAFWWLSNIWTCFSNSTIFWEKIEIEVSKI